MHTVYIGLSVAYAYIWLFSRKEGGIYGGGNGGSVFHCDRICNGFSGSDAIINGGSRPRLDRVGPKPHDLGLFSGTIGMIVVNGSWLGVTPHSGSNMAVLAPGRHQTPRLPAQAGREVPCFPRHCRHRIHSCSLFRITCSQIELVQERRRIFSGFG